MALGLLASLGLACAFEPPETAPIPTEFLDATPPGPDGGVPDAGPDAELPTDAEAPELGAPDRGAPDASEGPDALPGDTLPGDADPLPDGGADAGLPDAAPPDAGPPADAGCGLPRPASPQLVATFSVPHEIDAPALLFDADGDDEEELVVASRADRVLSVIDLDDCGRAQVSTLTNVRMDRDGPAGMVLLGAPAIVTAGNGELRAYRYDPAANPALFSSNALRVQNLGTLEFVTGDPPGESFLLSGLASDGDPVFFAFDSELNRTETDLSSRLTAHAAFLGPFGAALARYLGVSAAGLHALQPGQSDLLIDSGSGLVPESAVSVFRLGTVPVTGRALGVYAARQSTNARELRFALVNPQSPDNPDRGNAPMTQRLRSGPVLATRDHPVLDDELFVYYVREPNHLHGCTVSNLAAGVLPVGCEAFPGATSGINLGASQSHPSIEPVTAYVNGDADPDVIIAARGGTVSFFQHTLTQAAAVPVQLGLEVAATPAMSLALYDRLGASGTALFVPHSDGTVSLIGWATPTSGGSAARLWFQHRRDAARSGSL